MLKYMYWNNNKLYMETKDFSFDPKVLKLLC